MPRLAWRFGERVPVEDVQVADSISQTRDVAFVCDTSLIHDRLDPAILSALLAVPKRMVLTPLVMRELSPWLKSRPQHAFTRAIKSGDAQPAELLVPEDDEPGRAVYDYYTWLLTMRRSAIAVAERRFEQEQGRPLADTERRALEKRIHQDLGPRGFLLAKKGHGELPTDEQLVYLAVDHALRTGQKTVILTSDADVEEQFFKLLWLIDTHYRAMLLAKHYLETWATLKPHRLPREIADHPQCPFEDRGTVLIDRGDADLRYLLPKTAECVPIACWTVGVASFSGISFMAERGMTKLLDVKDKTGGLSTDLLGGRNVHPWLAPLPIRGADRNCAAIARDRRTPLPGSRASVAALDIGQAVTTLERHAGFEGVNAGPVTINSVEGTPLVYHPTRSG